MSSRPTAQRVAPFARTSVVPAARPAFEPLEGRQLFAGGPVPVGPVFTDPPSPDADGRAALLPAVHVDLGAVGTRPVANTDHGLLLPAVKVAAGPVVVGGSVDPHGGPTGPAPAAPANGDGAADLVVGAGSAARPRT